MPFEVLGFHAHDEPRRASGHIEADPRFALAQGRHITEEDQYLRDSASARTCIFVARGKQKYGLMGQNSARMSVQLQQPRTLAKLGGVPAEARRQNGIHSWHTKHR